MKRLGTFLHISDLHFGPVDQATRDARADWWRRLPIFDGCLGHTYSSLHRLEEFYTNLYEREPDTRLIVTGDLTAMGELEEFQSADEFLGLAIEKRRINLGVAQWWKLATPGNHDHLGGKLWPLRPLALPHDFRDLPLDQPVSLAPDVLVRVLRINTDVDVSPFQRRFPAEGRFISQLDELTQQMTNLNSLVAPQSKEIRVLCLHHSRSYRGCMLEIHGASRTKLDKFLVRHKIRVLLCGHIHEPPLLQKFSVRYSEEMLEARCGTTGQAAKSFRQYLPIRCWQARQLPNSLLVHRVYEDYGEIFWETELYFEEREGFIRADLCRPSVQASERIRVWPRL